MTVLFMGTPTSSECPPLLVPADIEGRGTILLLISFLCVRVELRLYFHCNDSSVHENTKFRMSSSPSACLLISFLSVRVELRVYFHCKTVLFMNTSASSECPPLLHKNAKNEITCLHNERSASACNVLYGPSGRTLSAWSQEREIGIG
jgi:hypothetical protein